MKEHVRVPLDSTTWGIQPPRGEAWSAMAHLLRLYRSLGHQEGFLEEGASQLRLERRVGADLVGREEAVSGRGKGMRRAKGHQEQGEFRKHG